MPSKGGAGGGERTIDDGALIAVLIVGVMILIWIAWIAFHPQISMVYTYIRRFEFGWISLISSFGIPGFSPISNWLQQGCAARGFLEPCTRDFSTMSWREITNMAYYANVIFLPFVLLFAFKIFMRIQSLHPNLRFSKTFNVDSFVREKKAIYRHLRMFDELSLIEAPLDDPVLGMSQTSRQFVFHHRLIIETGEVGDGWISEADGSCTPVLDRKKTEDVLREQLGSVWTGVAHLTDSETLLLAIAIPRVAATNGELDDVEFKACLNESNQMIEWCWDQFKPPNRTKKQDGNEFEAKNQLDWLKPKIELSVPREIILRHIKSKPMQAILSKHAYVRTVIFAAFKAARSLGVLPPADMRWLRFYDRTLWYVLQNFGRQGVFAEGCAVNIHYLYEIKSGEALVEPQLDKAINALDEALTAFKYRSSDRDAYLNAGRAISEAGPV